MFESVYRADMTASSNKKFAVKIVLAYETIIEVEAASVSDAKTRITEYGILPATRDFRVIEETLSVERIKSVARIP